MANKLRSHKARVDWKHSNPIIIEGPDGSGKSTLVDQYFPNAIHAGGPPINHEEAIERLYEPTPGHVYDRWTGVSEQIYGPLVRGVSLLSEEEYLDGILKTRPTIIYCRPPLEVILSNLVNQKEKPHKPKKFIKEVKERAEMIVEAYDKLLGDKFPRLGVPVFTYDYSKGMKS